MDGAEFTRQLTAWLDPFRLISLALEYTANPAELERRCTGTREASAFTRARDVGLDHLIETFLEHFELSNDMLAALRSGSQIVIADEALARLSGLRFTGKASFENLEALGSVGSVVAFTGPKIEVMTIAGPINFLIRFVDQLAAMWSKMSRKAFYEPSFHTEFAVYVECTVARTLGFSVDSAWSGCAYRKLRPD